ncbi:MAG TPA: hypothetical protein VEA15_12115 [Caulobacteraceae bacterium]|nr:hypothetical protein [Caulobacteraceae bacterium]
MIRPALAALAAAGLVAACSQNPPPGDKKTAGAMPGAETAEENAIAMDAGDAAPIPEGADLPPAQRQALEQLNQTDADAAQAAAGARAQAQGEARRESAQAPGEGQ